MPVKMEEPTFTYANVGNLLIEQREAVIGWIASHSGDTEAIARYVIQLAAIDQTLDDLGLLSGDGLIRTELDTLFLNIPDVIASPGSVFIESDAPIDPDHRF